MTATRLRVMGRRAEDLYKSTHVAKIINRTDAVFSNESGLVYSDTVSDFIVKKDYIYFLSRVSVSIYSKDSNTRVSLIRRPEQNLLFNCIYVNDTQIYVGTNDGIYSIPITSALFSNADSLFKLKFSAGSLGGSNIQHITGRVLQDTDVIAATHEGGLVTITNDGEYISRLDVGDSNPGDVFITDDGNIYYGNGDIGLYFIETFPSDGPISIVSPFSDYIYQSLPSNDFRDIKVNENTVNDFRNTVFVATASGISVITEDVSNLPLSTIKNIPITNVSDMYIDSNSKANSGYVYYTVTDGESGSFNKYNLSTDTLEVTYSTSNEEIFKSNNFVKFRDI